MRNPFLRSKSPYHEKIISTGGPKMKFLLKIFEILMFGLKYLFFDAEFEKTKGISSMQNHVRNLHVKFQPNWVRNDRAML